MTPAQIQEYKDFVKEKLQNIHTISTTALSYAKILDDKTNINPTGQILLLMHVCQMIEESKEELDFFLEELFEAITGEPFIPAELVSEVPTAETN